MLSLLLAASLATMGACERKPQSPFEVLQLEPADVEALLTAAARYLQVPRPLLPPVVPGSLKMARQAKGKTFWAIVRLDATHLPPPRSPGRFDRPPMLSTNLDTLIFQSIGEDCRWKVVSTQKLPESCPSNTQLPTPIQDAWSLETSCARPGRPCVVPPPEPGKPTRVPACVPYIEPAPRGGTTTTTLPKCRDRPKS